MKLTDKEKKNLNYFASHAKPEIVTVACNDNLIFVYPKSHSKQFGISQAFNNLNKLFDRIKKLMPKDSIKKVPLKDNYARVTIGYYRSAAKTINTIFPSLNKQRKMSMILLFELISPKHVKNNLFYINYVFTKQSLASPTVKREPVTQIISFLFAILLA